MVGMAPEGAEVEPGLIPELDGGGRDELAPELLGVHHPGEVRPGMAAVATKAVARPRRQNALALMVLFFRWAGTREAHSADRRDPERPITAGIARASSPRVPP